MILRLCPARILIAQVSLQYQISAGTPGAGARGRNRAAPTLRAPVMLSSTRALIATEQIAWPALRVRLNSRVVVNRFQ